MVACPRCGAPNSLGNLFCSNCGVPLTTSVPPATIPAPYPPMWPPAPAPRATGNLTAIVVVLVIVILVALAGVAAVLVGRQISITPPSPRVMGVVVARSADGTNWTLTITSVPTGLFPSTAKLAILTSGGAIALAPTPFASLNYPSQRATYVQSQPGGPVAVGDRHSHSIATHRHRKTVAEGPRLLGERPGDVRDDVAEAIVGDDDSIEAAFALLRLPEVEIDEIADRRADILDLGPGHEMRRHRREEIASVERVGEFGPAQLSIRDLAHLLETESPRRRDEESVVRAHEEGSLADAHDRAALRAHAGVDHADVSGERIVRDRRIQDVGPVANVVRPDRMVDVHDCGLRVDCKDRALHGADVLARSEVGGQRDDRAHTLRPPQLRRRNPSLIRASSFLRRWISTSAFAARASRSLSFVSRVLRADCAPCTATCSAARASRSAASFASRSSMPARWAATASCRRFPSASARATRFSASDSRSSTSSIRCWRLSSFSRRAASGASTSRSPASRNASRRWISCFDLDSRLEIASDRFSSFFVSCACEASDLARAALRDSISCRSERNAVSCSSKVAFNDSFDSDSFVSARSAAATSLSRRSSSTLLAAYSSSSAARRDRKSPSTTSAASDRSVVRSSAATAAFSRFSIAASRRFAAASRLSSSRSAVSIAWSRCWAVRSERSSFTACAFILERLPDSSSSMRSSRRFNCSSSFPRLARSRWRRRTST